VGILFFIEAWSFREKHFFRQATNFERQEFFREALFQRDREFSKGHALFRGTLF
jgi:hypothetical protein